MNRRDMLTRGSCLSTVSTGLIFLISANVTFEQQVMAELPVPLKRMIVTLPTPAATTTGTPAGSAGATPGGSATSATLPSTVNVNLTPTDRVVTTTKTIAEWVSPPAAPGDAAHPQAGTTTKNVLKGTDECVTVSDVASPAKQAQTATAAAMLYFERSLMTEDSNEVFTVTVDGDVMIELLSVVAFDNETNRPIPLALELKPSQQQNQTKCPFTSPICAPATAGQGGTGSSGATGTTGAGTGNATKPPATLRITIKGAVSASGGVLRVTVPSKQIHAGAVTYYATGKQRVWREIMIANGAQHGPQMTGGAQGGVGGAQGGATGAQGGTGNQGCGGATPGRQGQQGGTGQQTPPPPSWTVGAEVVVMDPTGKTVLLKGKLGTPIVCDEFAVLYDAIHTLDAVILAVKGLPDKNTADGVLMKWKSDTPKSLAQAVDLGKHAKAVKDAINDKALDAMKAELKKLTPPASKDGSEVSDSKKPTISPDPFQELHKEIVKVCGGLKSVSEVVLFIDKLAALAKAASDYNLTTTKEASNAAATTLKSGETDLDSLTKRLKEFTEDAITASDNAIDGIKKYNKAQQDYKAAPNDTERNATAATFPRIRAELQLAQARLAGLVDHELTSAETVVQRLAIDIDADNKYVDLGTIIAPAGKSGVPADIGQLPRVVRLINKLAAPASCEMCSSADESDVIPTATVINIDFPGCLRGTVTLAAALPPGPAPPNGSVGPGLPPNHYTLLTITEAFLNVVYLPVANTLDPGLRVVAASKKPAAAWLPLSAANSQLDYLQAESFKLTTEPADNIAYFDSRAGQIALKLPKTSKDPESIWSVSTSAANLTIDDTVDDWSTALTAITPNLSQLILAIKENPTPAGVADQDPDPVMPGLCRLINLDGPAKAGLVKVPNKSPRLYFVKLNQNLTVAMVKAKVYSDINVNEGNATTQIALIHRQVRQLKNRHGRDDFNPQLLELGFEREDLQAQKTDAHIRRKLIGNELLHVVGKF